MSEMADYYMGIGWDQLCDFNEGELGATYGGKKGTKKYWRRLIYRPPMNAPYGLWHSKEGVIKIKDMSTQHINNVLNGLFRIAPCKIEEFNYELKIRERDDIVVKWD